MVNDCMKAVEDNSNGNTSGIHPEMTDGDQDETVLSLMGSKDASKKRTCSFSCFLRVILVSLVGFVCFLLGLIANAIAIPIFLIMLVFFLPCYACTTTCRKRNEIEELAELNLNLLATNQ